MDDDDDNTIRWEGKGGLVECDSVTQKSQGLPVLLVLG